MMITLVIILVFVNILLWSELFYKQFFKRFYDIVLSGVALIFLSPIFLVLTVLGSIKMKGNPFFTQERPGKNEKIFKLIKFRSMTFEKDENGIFLPDDQRLTNYGKILRSTSLDELPELFNIFKGDMSIIGPRPLLVRYLPRYSQEQHRRHSVRPGLTGYAQIHGRNTVCWNDKFKMDVWYVNNYSLKVDFMVFWATVLSVLKREGISSETSATMEEFIGSKGLYT